SVIKVKDDAGDYWTVFGGLNEGDKPLVENVHISNLRIDQNPSGNTTCNIDATRTDTIYWRQNGISLFNYKNIVIDHVHFDPTPAVNAITLNRLTGTNARITNCYFNFVMGKGNGTYDNSTIYVNGRNHVIANNVFYSELG